MHKKIIIAMLCLVISFGLVGCDITLNMVNSIASTATFLVSENGGDYYGSISYAGSWWHMNYNVASGWIKFGTTSWAEVNTAKNLFLLAGYNFIPWESIPVITQEVILTHILDTLPLISVYQAPLLILPVLPGMPQLVPVEMPM